jgi:pimeloyl-ACP methyl ester carboxylesterase
MSETRAFTLHVSDAELDDLRHRLAGSRWPDEPAGIGWDYGTDPAYLSRLVDYWRTGFDWRDQEAWLNSFPQFVSQVADFGIHYVRARGRGAAPIPVLLLHGWPGSFVQMLDLVPLLADPAAHGRPDAVAFDVVAASLPGFGFSDRPAATGMDEAAMADLFHGVMTGVLGYDRYAVHGTDFGGTVATHLAARYPAHIIGLHVGGTSPRVDESLPDLSAAERRYAERVRAWRAGEVGYGAIQGTRPQTLAPALNDSPMGLASWLVEKFRRWSDCDGDLDSRFTMDQLLTNIMVYWASETIGSSIRLYRDGIGDADLVDSPVPAAFLMPAKDMLPTPREWVARTARIDRWTPVDRGGHFIEWEEPALVADDMRAFFAVIR